MLRRERDQKEKGIGRFLGLKRALAVNVAVFAVVGWGLTGEFLRNRDMQKEIDRLDSQAKQMERQNLRLEDLGRRFSSDAMLEREARTKLNLQKPGEQAVVVRDAGAISADGGASSGVDDSASGRSGDVLGNASKWWHYFFR